MILPTTARPCALNNHIERSSMAMNTKNKNETKIWIVLTWKSVSPDIFEFLTAGKNSTEPPCDVTSIEAELTNAHGQAEAELMANPFEVGLPR